MSRKVRGPVKLQSYFEQNLTLLCYRSMQIWDALVMINRLPYESFLFEGKESKWAIDNPSKVHFHVRVMPRCHVREILIANATNQELTVNRGAPRIFFKGGGRAEIVM